MKINSINNNFKGLYVSKAFAPDGQYKAAQTIAEVLRKSGFVANSEKQNKDVLLLPAKDGFGVDIKLVKYNIKRILDDNFSRWCGKF